MANTQAPGLAKLPTAPPNGLQAIKQAAASNGIAWQPLAAIAHHESNLNPGAVGDQGTSAGLFQLHRGGALPANVSIQQALNPAWNANFAARAIKALGIQNLPFNQQTQQISARFERPQNVAGEVADANSWLAKLGPAAAAGGTGLTRPTAATGAPTLQSTTSANGGTAPSISPLSLAPLQASLDLGQQTSQRALDALGKISGKSVEASAAPDLTALTTAQDKTLQPAAAKPATVSLKAPVPTHLGTQAAKVIELAKHYLGTKYVFGGATPKTGFDCSGLIQYIEGLNGVKLPRTAAEQAQVGKPVATKDLQPGDRLYFQTEGSAAGVTHTALYIGNGQLIEAPHTGDVVKIAPLAGYYATHLVAAKRGG